VVFRQRFFTEALEFVFVLFVRNFILQSQLRLDVALPLRLEPQYEVLLGVLLHNEFVFVEFKLAMLGVMLVEFGLYLPLLVRVIDNRNLLRNRRPCWHSELKLSLDLLRLSLHLNLEEPDINSILRLENHVARIFCRFARSYIQDNLVLHSIIWNCYLVLGALYRRGCFGSRWRLCVVEQHDSID